MRQSDKKRLRASMNSALMLKNNSLIVHALQIVSLTLI